MSYIKCRKNIPEYNDGVGVINISVACNSEIKKKKRREGTSWKMNIPPIRVERAKRNKTTRDDGLEIERKKRSTRARRTPRVSLS